MLLNFVRLIGCLAEPYIPSFSAKLYEILNIKYNEEEGKLLKKISSFITNNPENAHMFLLKLNLIPEGHVSNEPLPLFKLISQKEVDEWKIRYGGKDILIENGKKEEEKVTKK